jgi:hypothetical protein
VPRSRRCWGSNTTDLRSCSTSSRAGHRSRPRCSVAAGGEVILADGTRRMLAAFNVQMPAKSLRTANRGCFPLAEGGSLIAVRPIGRPVATPRGVAQAPPNPPSSPCTLATTAMLRLDLRGLRLPKRCSGSSRIALIGRCLTARRQGGLKLILGVGAWRSLAAHRPLNTNDPQR